MLIKKINRYNFLLILILLLTSVLLIYDLGEAPPGALVDEVSVGYNAYSVLLTGKDEWGDRLPLTLKSFGDFKTTGYLYFSIPFVKLFGLNLFSIRLPSVVAGLFSIILTYLIADLLTKNKSFAILSAFLLGTSPWYVFMNRMAWDQNLTLPLFLAGLFFLLYQTRRLINIILSAFLFSLTLDVYAGYKILTPLFLMTFLYFFYLKKIITIRTILIFSMLFFIFSLPYINEVLFKGGATRFNQVSIFNQVGPRMFIDEQRAFCGMQQTVYILPLCYLIWNKGTVLTGLYLKNYISSISTDFLFLTGDTSAHINNPNHGGLYFWLSPFFFFGIYVLLKGIKKKYYQFILLWFLISPIMSALADKPQFSRSYMILIPVILICSLGVHAAIGKIGSYNNKYKSITTLIFIIGVLLSVLVTMVDYLFVYTKKAEAWDEHQKKIYSYLATVDKNYDSIYVKKINSNPYIYMAFYLALDPNYFQKNVKRNGYEVTSVGKYYFVNDSFNTIYCNWLAENMPKTVFVTDEMIEDLKPIYKATGFNGVYTRAAVYNLELSHQALEENKGRIECAL